MEAAKAGWLYISNSESPEFVGRVIAALAEHSSALNCSGQALVAATLAQELGIKDDNDREAYASDLGDSLIPIRLKLARACLWGFQGARKVSGVICLQRNRIRSRRELMA